MKITIEELKKMNACEESIVWLKEKKEKDIEKLIK